MCAEQTRSIRKKRPVYTLKDGTKAPGVTTILNLRAKPNLYEWYFRLGKENPHLERGGDYVDDLARIGSAAHALVAAFLTGEKPDVADFTPNEIKAAEVPLEKFKRWASEHSLVVVASEKVVTSERHRYAGTMDLKAMLDGKLTVADLKTGSAAYAPKIMEAIFNDNFTQCSAYAEADMEETGQKVEQLLSIRLGRNESEGMATKVCTSWGWHFRSFLNLRALYESEWNRDHNVPYRD